MKHSSIFTIVFCWLLLLANGLFAQDFAAVSFGDDGGYISTNWDPAFGTDQDFAIDFSIRSAGWSSDPAIFSDKDWGSGTNAGFNIALASSGNGIDVNIGDGTNRADLESGTISDGKWHHVLVSFDRDGLLTMWIDGAEAQNTDLSGVGDITSTYMFNIAQDGTGDYSSPATCDLTNVRVWNAALVYDNISDIACNQITPGHPYFSNLIHYWAMQEADGTLAADAIGGEDGTLQGAASWTDGTFPTLDISFESSVSLSTAEFMNTSTDASRFFWQFGDGNTSELENPTHTYLSTGMYNVTLTAGNACQEDNIVEPIEITELNSNLKQAVNLNGTGDYIAFDENVEFGNTVDFSIELLVRSEGWSSDPAIFSNKDWGSGSNPGFIIAGKGNGETWKLNVGDGSSRIDLDGGVINDGLWHHIAVTYDQDGMKKIYQDGVEMASSDEILGDINNTLDLAIGQDGTLNYGAFFAGQVSEVRIWNAVLDSMTIAENICEATDQHPFNANLLHYWKIDEGAGTMVNDSRGTNDGLYNGGWNTTLFTINCSNDGNAEGDFNAIQTGTSYLTTDWIPQFDTTQDFAIDFRIRTDGWSSDPAIFSNKDWGSGTNVGFNIALATNGQSIDVNVGDGSNRADLASGAIADGEWHHVLVNADRDGELAMYIDGTLTEATDMSDVDSIVTSYTFNIGQDGTGAYSTTASCDLAYVRVWDRVMSVDELNACGDMDDASPVWDDLLHFWKMSEGAGNPVDEKAGTIATWQGAEAWTFFNNYPEMEADFMAEVLLSNVSFVNESTPGSYYWHFGDGETSTAVNPAHTYFNTGIFDVTLVVVGACSSDTLVQSIQIDALDQNLLTSLDLDGNEDFVQFDNDLDFGSTEDFTIELFVRSNGWNSDPSIIANKDWGSGSNPGFIIAGKGDGQSWKVNIGDGTSRIDLDGGPINDDVWHHIAFAYDQDGNKTIFQDGQALAVSTDVLGDINSTLDLAIGQDGTLNYSSFFKGQVAEVRIWSVALDTATIAEYQCGADNSHPNYADLIHYWACDEGTGTNVGDAIGTNDGLYTGDWIVTANTIDGCESFAPVNDIGSGNCIEFEPDDTGWIDCSGAENEKVSAESIGLPTEAITIECWVRPTTYSIWHSMVSFIQDNGNFEKGWDLETRGGNKFAFALSTVGEDEGLIYLETFNEFEENTWYHVAGVFDGTEQRIYVNGILENSRTTESDSIDYADSWLALGIYKDDNENFTLDGQLDEVRIWNTALTVDEIRENMCQKLTGDEADLYAYYRLDNLAGTDIRDYGPNALHGEMINMNAPAARLQSGAAIGDESIQLYTDDFVDAELEMTTADRGTITVENMQGNRLEGVHLYRVNQLPNTVDGIFDLGDNNVYYGTFIADPGKNASHKLTYNYSNYANAVANEASLSIYNRQNNAIPIWLGAGSSRDEANDEVYIETVSSRREFILGDFSASACMSPSNISLDEVMFTEATLSWTSNGTTYNVQYGPAGFVFGTASAVDGHAGQSITLTDLEARTNYDMYVQADCDGSTSAWVGPFTFKTADPCGVPTDIETINITSSSARIIFEAAPTTMNFDLQWGTAGFVLGTGITTSSTETMVDLEFLPANTAIEYYVRSNCENEFGLVSDWVGPFAFSTNMSGSRSIEGVQRFHVYPNPAKDNVTLEIISQTSLRDISVEVSNGLGQRVFLEQLPEGQVIGHQLDLTALAAGTYYVRIKSNDQYIVRKVIKQ